MKDKTPSPFNSGSTAGLPDPFAAKPSNNASFFTGGAATAEPPKPTQSITEQNRADWPNRGRAPQGDALTKGPGTGSQPLNQPSAKESNNKSLTSSTNPVPKQPGNKSWTSSSNKGKSRSKTW